jgi:uncharacterized protein (TIGR02001 family)
MLKKLSLSLLSVAVLSSSSLFAESNGSVEISANVAMTNNYIWRGMTQNDDEISISGGFDLGHESGLYIGTWAAVAGGTELDLYGGYAGSLSFIDYDIGYISYQYPNVKDGSADFEEAYISLSKEIEALSLGVTYSAGMDDATDNIEASVGYDLGMASLSLVAGDYDEVGTYYKVGVSKDIAENLNLALEYADYSDDASTEGDQDNFVVTLSSSF